MTEASAIVPEITDISLIIPYEKNAKKHDETQIEKLAKSITKFGWTQPIVVDIDGVIIAGHGRRLAALHLGLKKVPVVWRKDLTKAEAAALRLADNRVASTEYDLTLIQDEMQALLAFDPTFDLGLTGYDDKEINFSTSDLTEMNSDFFVDDVGSAVEQQAKENAAAAEAADDVAAPVADALGFKRVTIAQSRELRGLMDRIESKTGKKGIDALIDVLSAAA